MSIITVTGEISAEKAGFILPHEHIFCDLKRIVPYQDNGVFDGKITLETHGLLTRNPYAIADNAVLDGYEIMKNELLEFKRAGGGTVGDATTVCFGRDPELLKRMSVDTGVFIIMGCGHYTGVTHPAYVSEKSVGELCDTMTAEITAGVGHTGIRAGMIGEIGTSKTITENEKKVLIAASIAQGRTGAGLHIHTSLYNREGYKAAKIALENGAEPSKICINHTDVMLDMAYIKSLLDLGIKLEFDNFGKEFYVDRRFKSLLEGRFAYDLERVKAMKELIDCGYAKQLIISNDVCLKSMLHTYGGWGFDHILTNIIPMMGDVGITENDIDVITRKNVIDFFNVE